ncbi:MAG: cytochrome c oxidase accessory protein CcoG [Micropepsaceae bacterium]
MEGPASLERTVRTAMEAAEGVARSDVEAVNSAVRRTLYKAREPIYPKSVKGTFRRIKWAVMAVLLAVYYIVPFIRFDRGIGKPDQAVLVDLDRPRLYFFWLELWPQEIYFLAGLLILAALALFLFTALFGRVWCGYACPQTVWTDLYIAVENWIEGDRGARIRLAKEPWSARKLGKRLAKHAIWLLIAVATGGAWVLYFYDAPTFLVEFFTGAAPLMAYVFVAGLTFTTYTLAGFMREQVCTYMCPWPRIQGAMVDVESISVTYLKARGEPRGRHKKGASWDGRGDCIDCNQCVAACPMGIDIRDGDQLECINCGLCIDACDEVMDKVGRPRGLIAYESHAGVERRRKGLASPIRFVRTRTVFYAVVLAAVGLIMLAALIGRTPVGIAVLRDRNPVFVRLSNGDIRNAYTIKIMNRGDAPVALVLTATGLPGAALTVAGHTPADDLALTVAPDEIRSVRLLVTVPADPARPVSHDIAVGVASADGAIAVTNDTVFLSGQP